METKQQAEERAFGPPVETSEFSVRIGLTCFEGVGYPLHKYQAPNGDELSMVFDSAERAIEFLEKKGFGTHGKTYQKNL